MDKVVGRSEATTENLFNPAKDPEILRPVRRKMKALVWNGKNWVKVVDTSKPAKIEAMDVIV